MPPASVDGPKVEQAVMNLLLNAIDAIPEGGHIGVWVKNCRLPARAVEIGVHDNGPGLDSRCREELFEPFVSTKSQGIGLGLSNVKNIVEAHAGELELKGRKGRGATFVLRFPCQ
jgi:signal transduction histidine kinase